MPETWASIDRIVTPPCVIDREVLVDRVVEAQPALVAQLHHQHRGEGLGVGRDRELVVRTRRGVEVGEVGRTDPAVPHQLPVPGDGRDQAGQAVLTLAITRDGVEGGNGLGSEAHPRTLGIPRRVGSRRGIPLGTPAACEHHGRDE